MRAAAVLATLPFVVCSCIGITFGPSSTSTSGDSGSSSNTTNGTSSDDAGEGGVQGINCGPDPDTGVVLCLGISSCPGLTVDQDVFPGCGFRVHSSPDVLDLECACFGQICPIGIATSCDQATALMTDQSQYTVCMQVNEGRCTAN